MPNTKTKFSAASLITEVQKRAQTLENQGVTPWRVELGHDWSETYEAIPLRIAGLPVEIVPIGGYLRVAYRESYLEQPPGRDNED